MQSRRRNIICMGDKTRRRSRRKRGVFLNSHAYHNPQLLEEERAPFAPRKNIEVSGEIGGREKGGRGEKVPKSRAIKRRFLFDDDARRGRRRGAWGIANWPFHFALDAKSNNKIYFTLEEESFRPISHSRSVPLLPFAFRFTGHRKRERKLSHFGPDFLLLLLLHPKCHSGGSIKMTFPFREQSPPLFQFPEINLDKPADCDILSISPPSFCLSFNSFPSHN